MYQSNKNNTLLGQKYLKIGFLLFGVGLIALALFPYGVLAEQSRVFRFVIYRIFDTELSHIIGHFVIFSFIGTAVLLAFPKLFRTPILYLSVMLNMAWIQEFLQLATFKRRPINSGELKDLGVDLAAAVFIFCIIYPYHRRQQQKVVTHK